MKRLTALRQEAQFFAGDHTDQLRILLELFASQLNQLGYQVAAYRGTFPNSKYLELPVAHQQRILDAFSFYYDVCAASLESGERDDRTMAWSMLLRLKLTPLADVFGHLQRGDIIEIYNEHSVQIFRSFSFFQLVSYTLEELFTYEWWELYARPQTINVRMFELGSDILFGRQKSTVLAGVEPHVVEETFSQQRRRASITEVLLSPLMNASNQLGGFIHAFRADSLVTTESSPKAPLRLEVR